MAQPWLDSLSEDWNSQPRSSPPASLPAGTPTASLRSTNSALARSRIPKYASATHSSRAHQSLNPRKRKPSSAVSKRVLTERSESENNASFRSSINKHHKEEEKRRNSWSSSNDSGGSVIHDGSVVQRRPQSSSPARSEYKNTTPEWKRLVMQPRVGASKQADLFSPMGLEEVFQRPPPDRVEDSLQSLSNLKFAQDVDSMPSSPPPWPSSVEESALPVRALSSRCYVDPLEAVEEGDESEQHSLPLNSKNRDLVFAVNDTAEPNSKQYQFPEPAFDPLSLQNTTQPKPIPNERSISTSRTFAGKETSSSTGFSPVFISKHNNNGQVNYAPIDTSNPDVAESLRRMAVSSENQHAQRQTKILPNETPVRFAESFEPNAGPSLAEISPYVNMARGGNSDDGSFKRRPLSPSVSSSIAPADSISQLQYETQEQNDGFLRRKDEQHPSRHQPVPRRSDLEPEPENGRLQSPSKGLMALNNSLEFFERHRDKDAVAGHLEAIHEHDIAEEEVEASYLLPNDDIAEGRIDQTTRGESILPRDNNRPAVGADFEKPASPSLDGAAKSTDAHLSRRVGSTASILSRENYERLGPLQLTSDDSHDPQPLTEPSMPQVERETDPEDAKPAIRSQNRQSAKDTQRTMEASIGQKRRDARYDEGPNAADPALISKREILLPRNTALPPQHFRRHSYSNEGSTSGLQNEAENAEEAAGPAATLEDQTLMSLASKVATLRMQAVKQLNASVRKGSVSTQDYLDEAMKIMEIIRQKRLPLNTLSDLEESNAEYPQDWPNLSVQTISRPPSREGKKSAWRTRNDVELDEAALKHLKKYEESVNDSFMSSAFNALDLATDLDDKQLAQRQKDLGDFNNDNQTVDDESYPGDMDQDECDDWRPGRDSLQIMEVPHNPNPEEVETQTLPPEFRTHASNASTDSSDKTLRTDSSQRTRVLTTIAPEQISHLITGKTAGMRFDPESKTWVKYKASTQRSHGLDHISSSGATEEDPFNDIPDLSVNDNKEAVPARSNGSHTATHNDDEEPDSGLEYDDANGQDFESSQLSFDNDIPVDKGSASEEDRSPYCSFQYSSEMHPRREDPEPFEDDSKPHGYTQQPSPAPKDAPGGRRRDMSVFFSSPPVSHTWPARSWPTTSEGDNITPQSNLKDSRLREPSEIGSDEIEEIVNCNTQRNRIIQNSPLVSRTMSMSYTNDQQEFSMIEEQSNGRRMSLTLSISTPLPRSNHRQHSTIATSGLRRRGILASLSPLSEFTMHHDNRPHMLSANLTGAERTRALGARNDEIAVSAHALVQSLTDVEPDEPYWDQMRSLDFGSKELENLHMLDEFCPRLEYLNASSNRLTQLKGAPLNIRQLNVQQNMLSSLTAWEHLANLQYLDVSRNELDSLEGLHGLVHLRTLIADDNQITRLEGVLDLDGLLTLSVKRNRLTHVDFSYSNLKCLTSLDMSENGIQQIEGISSLSQLDDLHLEENKLVVFPESQSAVCTLKRLTIQGNLLESLDVTAFPALECINADGNKLDQIAGLSTLTLLESVSLRDQSVETSSKSLFVEEMRELSHIHLSGVSLPSLPMKTSFLNLRTLELASAGLTSLPDHFGRVAPNLRSLNLNFNGVKDLRPLRGIIRLKELHTAGNRLSRLRRTLAVVQNFRELESLDLRSNPFTVGFYDSIQGFQSAPTRSASKWSPLQCTLADANTQRDVRYYARLDQETKLKRRVYEMLLAGKCRSLKNLDGMEFGRERAFVKDRVWELLCGVGVIEEVPCTGQETCLESKRVDGA